MARQHRARDSERGANPMTWPVVRDALPGVHILTEPSGFKLCYCDTPPTGEQRDLIQRLTGASYVSPTGLAEAIETHLTADELFVSEQNVLKLRRLAGEQKWEQAVMYIQAFLDRRALSLSTRGTG